MYTIEQQRIEQLKLQQRRVIEAGKDYVKGLFTLGDKATREIDFDEGAKWMLLNQWISVEDECPIGTCVLLDKYGNMRLDRLQRQGDSGMALYFTMKYFVHTMIGGMK